MEVRNENFSPQSSFVAPMPPEGRRLLPPRLRAAKGGNVPGPWGRLWGCPTPPVQLRFHLLETELA